MRVASLSPWPIVLLTFFSCFPYPIDSATNVLWSDPIEMPIIAVAMANLDDQRILMWSGGNPRMNGSLRTGAPGKTFTSIWDPTTEATVSFELIETTQHDMFCPGTSILPNGKVMVTGGTNNARVSIYDNTGRSSSWTRGQDMNIGRGYHSNAVLMDGSVFVMGGSWFDRKGVAEYNVFFTPVFGWFLHILRYHIFDWLFEWLAPWERKDGELWDPITDEWRVLENVKCEGSVVTADKRGQYRNDNHFWIFQAPNGKIFHAGPSVRTHWITTDGPGSLTEAELRGSADAMNGNAIMYDIGKILVVGGAPDYDESPASKEAFVITLNESDDSVNIRQVSNMIRSRSMMNSVVLPNGQVVVIGGNEQAVVFDDSKAVLSAELWDPITETFTELPSMQIPRTYHSTALLLHDGRILAAGGGLCGENCELNHPDGEILTPPYLFSNIETGELAPRPVIISAPSFAVAGDSIDVDVSVAVQSFSLIRLSAATHSVNTDLRRIPLPIISIPVNNVYSLQLPANAAVSLPGTYFLFAMNSDGVPSIATIISVAPP